jgi:hypothetical protein
VCNEDSADVGFWAFEVEVEHEEGCGLVFEVEFEDGAEGPTSFLDLVSLCAKSGPVSHQGWGRAGEVGDFEPGKKDASPRVAVLAGRWKR